MSIWYRLTHPNEARAHVLREDDVEGILLDLHQRFGWDPLKARIEAFGGPGSKSVHGLDDDLFVFDYGGPHFADAPLVALGTLEDLRISCTSVHHAELLFGLVAKDHSSWSEDSLIKLHCAWMTFVARPEDIGWLIANLRRTEDEARRLATVERERLRLVFEETDGLVGLVGVRGSKRESN